MKFLFQKPKVDDKLSDQANLAVAVGALASRLVKERRTHVTHPGGRRENVAEHSLMLVKVATALAQEHYPHLDAGRVAIYASLHDDVEAYVGDTPTDSVSGHDKLAKKQLEEAGLRQLVGEYQTIAPSYTQYLKEYEAQDIPESRFVRVVDKIMVELIHLPNKGAELRKYYTQESAREATRQNALRLKEQYPEYSRLVEVRSEIAHYLIEHYIH